VSAPQIPAEIEEQHRLLTEQTLLGIAIIQGGRVRYVNQAFAAIVGATVEEMLTTAGFLHRVHPDDRSFIEDKVRRREAGESAGLSERSVCRALHEDGRIVNVEIFARTVTYQGAPADLVTMLDITQRLEAEAALRASEERYRLLCSNLTDVVWAADTALRFTLVSDAVTRIFGYTPNEIVGQPVTFGMSAASLPAAEERLKQLPERLRAEASPRLEPIESEHQRKDGSVVWTEVQAGVVLDKQGRFAGLTGITRDITQRRRALDLESQLQQAQKMEAVGKLAGGVAHDINNMLAAIMGLTSVMREDLDSRSPMREDLDSILAACRRGRDLTWNLLAFARKGKVLHERLSLNTIASDVRLLFERTAMPLKMTVTVELASDLAEAEGDPNQLSQALMHLALNAADAMPDGGTLVFRTANVELSAEDLRGEEELAPGPYVALEVRDTGVGMDERVKAHAFEPFFTTKPTGEGTGLGLAMVYGTARSHRGRVLLCSEPGKGTSVTIQIPARRSTASLAAAGVAGRKAPARGTVLLVDDEELVLRSTQRLLQHLGFTVLVARGGADAVRLLEQHGGEVSLAVLDLLMPGMDGSETFRRLRALKPELRVYLSSGFIASETTAALIAEGAAGFLQKPFRLEDLSSALGAD
jgi:two-component system, cell cycle sensor histidine kinase and response regulator CckA